mmetsp:Transcript_36717/g.59330  ORF Transcript_36717/g.59330 Transcript_36717/m.59330 type:complete len:445 (+) Transcript_36717:121-1455(+)
MSSNFDETISYTWTLRNLSKCSEKPIKSEPFGTRHFCWYIKVYPQGDLKQRELALESRFLSVYVGASPEDYDMRSGWTRQAKYTLQLLNPSAAQRRIQREIDVRTFMDGSEWGYTTFVSLASLKDQYLKEDSLTFWVEIKYSLSQRISECSSMGTVHYCPEFRRLLNSSAYADVRFGFRNSLRRSTSSTPCPSAFAPLALPPPALPSPSSLPQAPVGVGVKSLKILVERTEGWRDSSSESPRLDDGTPTPTGDESGGETDDADGDDAVTEENSMVESVSAADETDTAFAAVIYAHKAILVCRSDYFRALFSSGMKESMQEVIEVNGFDYDTFLGMLQFLYTGSVDRFRERRYALFEIADHYNLKELRAEAEAFIRKDLKADNAVEILEFADRFDSAELKAAALQVIAKDLSQVIATDGFKKLIGENDLLLQIFNFLGLHGLVRQ